MIYAGTVMELHEHRALIFTMDCGLVYIRRRQGMFLGQQVLFRQRDLNPAARIPFRRLAFSLTAIAAALALLLVGGGILAGLFSGLGLPGLDGSPYAFLALDVNPSVELALDRNDRIAALNTLNGDAASLFGDMDLTGLPAGEAVDAILETLAEAGYLARDEEGTLLLSGTVAKGLRFLERNRLEKHLQKLLVETAGRIEVRIAERTTLYVFYSGDGAVREQAEENGLSIGRQLLLMEATGRKVDMTRDEAKQADLKSLLEKAGIRERRIGLDPTLAPEPTDRPTLPQDPTDVPTSEPEPTEAPSGTPTSEPEPSDDPTATPEPTAEPTPKPTPKPTPTSAPLSWDEKVAIGAGSLADGHLLTWAPLPDNMALQYYKVVITRKSFSLAPKYPEDGYLAVMTDRSATSLRIDNSRKYNGGREGLQYLAVGEYYMISITYCLQDGTKYYGNAVKFAYKGPAGPTPTTAPTEAAPAWSQQVAVGEGSPTDGHLMTWTNPSSEWLGSRWLDGVKIVLSISNPTPIYSNDGYLAYLTGGNTSFRLDNGSSYNGGDIPGTGLVPGQSYYASVTYLISDGSRVRGNAVSFVYQGPAG